ncbi:uncharacterized protein LOC104583436 [Brachypodium distachyon]|uniref:Uncharacterized protein n=1 Tax=Brachypodium distachyon TaxID=15368 RepID=A0A0Q3HJE2_BRADI|nr:uncharacterized protein LOC104583436 [Brachypodium distachyon]KQJ93482.1 hypothetical protein BRADI_3g04871v3 [Brachypodium distachyon]|eukprot:XP_010233858.1 uncharacterized protein LOC104583436 [Brachypodium distachyon]
MERRSRAAECHGRFLRPGALARLRDSRIVARSLRSAAAAARLPLPSSAPPSPAAPAAAEQRQGGGVPHFLSGTPARGAARYPLRRRMAAARCVVFLPPTPEAEAFLISV